MTEEGEMGTERALYVLRPSGASRPSVVAAFAEGMCALLGDGHTQRSG